MSPIPGYPKFLSYRTVLLTIVWTASWQEASHQKQSPTSKTHWHTEFSHLSGSFRDFSDSLKDMQTDLISSVLARMICTLAGLNCTLGMPNPWQKIFFFFQICRQNASVTLWDVVISLSTALSNETWHSFSPGFVAYHMMPQFIGWTLVGHDEKDNHRNRLLRPILKFLPFQVFKNKLDKHLSTIVLSWRKKYTQ